MGLLRDLNLVKFIPCKSIKDFRVILAYWDNDSAFMKSFLLELFVCVFTLQVRAKK
jgi:hypothetical protein